MNISCFTIYLKPSSIIPENPFNLTTDYPDEHGYEEMGKGAFAARMGQGKTKTLQAGLQDFAFFCQSQLVGIIRAHLRNPCLDLLQPRPARGLLKKL